MIFLKGICGSFSAVILGMSVVALPSEISVDSTDATISLDEVDGMDFVRGEDREEGTKADDDMPMPTTAMAAKAAVLKCTMFSK
mmetsp:Transcript_3062/g.5028  ORF Transcript_3062/g.5028 Transcript_3062/m.5028 type:complete len:84 (-) Transcript_3062:30-281(-)